MYQRIINFVKDVQVNDAMSDEEKDAIINYCSGKIIKKTKLTPELLLKNGFKQNPENKHQFSKGLFRIIDLYGQECEENNIKNPLIPHGFRLLDLPDMVGLKRFVYVNDLQDVWYSIFNEQLIIK